MNEQEALRRQENNFIRNLIDSSVDSFHWKSRESSERSREQLERTEEKFKSNFNFLNWFTYFSLRDEIDFARKQKSKARAGFCTFIRGKESMYDVLRRN